MPVAMTLSVALGIAFATAGDAPPPCGCAMGRGHFADWRAGFTLIVNVPINVATGRWDAQNPPADWDQQRREWELFQGLRSWLLLLGFFCLCVSVFV